MQVANLELGQYIFADVIAAEAAHGYSARAHDPRAYGAIAADLLRRCA